MNKIISVLIGLFCIVGLGSFGLFCPNKLTYSSVKRQFLKVDIETLLQDSTLNIRALEIVKSDVIAPVYLTSNGEFGIIYPNSIFKHVDSLKVDQTIIMKLIYQAIH